MNWRCELQTIYNDQTFWKAMCQKHFSNLKTEKETDFRALFISTYQEKPPIRNYIHKVESVLDSIDKKINQDKGASIQSIRSQIKEIKVQNQRILTKDKPMLIDYVYLLSGLKDSLKDERFKSEL